MDSFLLTHISNKLVQYKANEAIFRTGDRIHSIFYVEKGHIKLTRDTLEGKSIINYIANEGQYFAEAALFHEEYHCNAVAISEASIRLFPKQEVLDLLLKRPDISLDYIQFLSIQVRDLRQQLEVVNIMNAKDRILQYVESQSKNKAYEYPGSLKNLAALLGLSHETLYRELKKLEDKGIIERNAHEIRII